MNIGIIGTRGIPNHYGGFEECAEQLGKRLAAKGHAVTVYNSHRHPFQNKSFAGINLIHKYDPEHRVGTIGQFVYDLNCILDARWRDYDILLMMGYTSSSIWQGLLPEKSLIITNMDGMEWWRSKYSSRVKKFLKRAEAWAARGSDLLVADSPIIKQYLNLHYKKDTVYIPYGAAIPKQYDANVIAKFNVTPYQYNLLIARLEPENSLETILSGIIRSSSTAINLVIGNHQTEYGSFLKERFTDSRIRFLQSNFNKSELNNLRHFSKVYFHGHTVGGTNPSLLEAMACNCTILAHANDFNRSVLGEDANYFLDQIDLSTALDHLGPSEKQKKMSANNLNKISELYNWDIVADQYELAMKQALIAR